MSESLKDIQIKFLCNFYSAENLSKKTAKDIDNLYTKHNLIDSLKTKGYNEVDISKWTIEKLKKEYKKYIIESNTITSKDIADNLLFNILN